jgi:thioredoxin 1
MLELTRTNFKDVVDRQAIVLVACWAPGCGVCRQFDPVFAKVAGQYEQHTFARMNIMTDDRLGEFFEIAYTPCLMVYRDGLLLLKKPGNFSEQELQGIIQQAESLDMDMVRADLASAETSTREEENNDD